MQGHIGTSLGAIGAISAIIGAAMAGLGAPWWGWTGFAIWGVLWVTAASGLSDAASRKFLAGTLRKSTFTQIYTTLAKRNVMGIWTRLCDPAPDGASVGAFFRAALTWRLYDFALLLSVAYPTLLLVGQWVMTGDKGEVGSFVVLPAADFWPARAAAILFILILTSITVWPLREVIKRQPTIPKIIFLLIAVSGMVTLGIITAGGLPSALLSSLAIVIIAASIGGIEGEGAFAGAFPTATAVVLPALAVDTGGAGTLILLPLLLIVSTGIMLHLHGRPCLARLLLAFGMIATVLIASQFINWTEVPEDVRSVFLFLAVLPLINAFFDVVSYAVTLSLIRRGLRSGLPFLWGLADLALACILLLGLGATLVAVIHGLNLLAGVPFLDLPALFAGVQADPGAYVWLYLMLFSTLLPTLLHGMLSLLGLQGIWPRVLRRPVAGSVEAAPASPLHAIRASLGLSVIWALPLLGLAFLLWLMWHYAQPALMAGLRLYLDGLLWIATTPVGAI